jgi:hypothetical protein
MRLDPITSKILPFVQNSKSSEVEAHRGAPHFEAQVFLPVRSSPRAVSRAFRIPISQKTAAQQKLQTIRYSNNMHFLVFDRLPSW